ncbi:hypothetical protein B296_00045028 [Ensete ventricosum]|uniref:Uncharacterized protein n=1 Tax=Ensete ventricosum TaxID=4639 RepID=A0A426XH47_ENSVE|nr:hypothetical protein B296_00045028 [Ensete ventricosum]
MQGQMGVLNAKPKAACYESWEILKGRSAISTPISINRCWRWEGAVKVTRQRRVNPSLSTPALDAPDSFVSVVSFYFYDMHSAGFL